MKQRIAYIIKAQTDLSKYKKKGALPKLKYKVIQKLIVACMLVIMLSGCTNNENLNNNLSDLEGNKQPTTEENKELSGTLTVSTFYDGYIDIHANNFMDMHPNVDIQIIKSDEEEFETWEGYANRVAVEP